MANTINNYRESENIAVIIQPLDGYNGAADGDAYQVLIKGANTDEDAGFVDMEEIRPNERRLTASRKNKGGGVFSINGFMRAASPTNFHGFMLRWAMGQLASSVRNYNINALSGANSVDGSTITGIADETFTTGAGSGLAVGDIVEFSTATPADGKKISKITAIVDNATGGNAASIAFDPPFDAQSAAATFNIKGSLFGVGPKTVWADVYIKYGDDDGEVSRSSLVETLNFSVGSGGLMFTLSGKSKDWEEIDDDNDFPASPTPVSDSEVWVFTDYVEESSFPANTTYGSDASISIQNSPTMYAASNIQTPVGGVLGIPKVSMNGDIFIEVGNNIKLDSKNEVIGTVRICLRKDNDWIAFELNGSWKKVTSNVAGPRTIITASGEFLASQVANIAESVRISCGN